MAIVRRLTAAPRKTRRRFWLGAVLAVVGVIVASVALTAGASSDHPAPSTTSTAQGAVPGISPADYALRRALDEMQFASDQVPSDEAELLAYLTSAEDYVQTARANLPVGPGDGRQPSSGPDSDLPAVLTAVGGLIAALAGLLTAGLSWRRAAAPALPVPEAAASR